jgi:hypothetical protein
MAEESAGFDIWELLRYVYWAVTLAVGIVAAIKLNKFPGGKLVAACFLLLVPIWFGTPFLYKSMAEAEDAHGDPYVGFMRASVISRGLGTMVTFGIAIGLLLLPGADAERRRREA